MRLWKIPWIAGVLKEFAFGGEDYEGDFSITKHRDLMSFLEQTRPSLGERYLPIDLVLDPLQLHPSSPHILPPHTASASNTLLAALIHSHDHHHTNNTIPTRIPVINNRSQERRRRTLQFPSIGVFLSMLLSWCSCFCVWNSVIYNMPSTSLFTYVRAMWCVWETNINI